LVSFGKVYTIFSVKSVFISGLIIFEAGSLLCTFAPSSTIFILGRALAGLGASALGGGYLKLLRHCFPLNKQALMGGLVGSCQSIGLVAAPVIGGALIDAFSWRACFGINLPLGILCVALTAYGFQDPVPNPDTGLPLKEKLKRVRLLDTVLVVPAITCLLMALQWGGAKYGWNDARIIVMFVLFGVLFFGFGYLQYRQGEDATLPLRIVKNRSILAAMWYSGCLNGILAMTEYYIAIYFQGVRGFTAAKSGLLGLPMIVGFGVAAIAAALVTTMIGYYFRKSCRLVPTTHLTPF
jgi:MFS family permease